MPSQTEPSPPKLFLRKPSKADLKKFKAKGGLAPAQRVASMDSSSSSSSQGKAPELAPKKTFLRRIFPFLLVVNFAVGAYVLLRTTQKRPDEKEEEVPAKEEEVVPLTPAEAPKPVPIAPPTVPKVVLPPIAESQQRELFKWILEEKRKVKPSSPAEKNKLNEEKALLKKFIRAESVSSL